MHIYFSGIGGVGIGPLAEIAHDAGYVVSGSDLEESSMTRQLSQNGISVVIGQSQEIINAIHKKNPIDLFIYTAALPDDHPELAFAKERDITTGKRDALLAKIINDKNLKLIAVAGTHGKTTTTGMLIWAFTQLKIPVSYSVGANLRFGPSGKFDEASEYFVYECDEYDRNFLHFEPYIAIITSLGYDHPDTYKTEHVYKNAFIQFMEQSKQTILWEKDLRYLENPKTVTPYEAYDELMDLSDFTLAGNHVRHNAYLALKALERLEDTSTFSSERLVSVINAFPGTSRRFEKLEANLYSDYGHHPSEIAATLQLARELSDHVVLVYQPHQNIRQHEIQSLYTDCMRLAEEIYWLPTYLSREDLSLEILTPKQLSRDLFNQKSVNEAEMDDELWANIQRARQNGKLVLVMGAGSVDSWIRSRI